MRVNSTKPDPRECEEARALMSEYVDGDIHPKERKRVEDHLARCPRCRKVLANLRHTLAALRVLRGASPPGLDDLDTVGERVGRAWRERA